MGNTGLDFLITYLDHSLEKGVSSLTPYPFNILCPLNVACIVWLFLEFSLKIPERRKALLQECLLQLGQKPLFDRSATGKGLMGNI